MESLTKKITMIGAVLAVSSIALVGCSPTTTDGGKEPSSSSSPSEAPSEEKATTAGAADFANEFFAAMLEEDTTDYSQLEAPVQLSETQAQSLLLDGTAEGVSQEDLNKLVDWLYETQPLGDFIYFSDDAPIQQRLQVISALMLAQNFALEMSAEEAPEKVLPEDVTLTEEDGVSYATFVATADAIAPALIFVDGEWKIDGAQFLSSIGIDPETFEEIPAE